MATDLTKLLRWADSPDGGARAEAAERLGDHLDDPVSVATLTKLVHDSSEEVTRYATASLKRVVEPSADVWDAVSTGLNSEHAAVRDACSKVLVAWGAKPVGTEHVISLLMTTPHHAHLVTTLVSTTDLIGQLDGSPARSLFVARRLAEHVHQSANERAAAARRMRARAAEVDEATAKELTKLAKVLERRSAHVRKKAESTRRGSRALGGKLKHYDAFRDDVLEGNIDGATDLVYMLSEADWAQLESDLETLSDDAMGDLIHILSHGPAKGLHVLLELLRERIEELADPTDPVWARAAADAISALAETFADEMAVSTSEANLLRRHLPEIPAALALVLDRPVPDET